MKKSGGRTAKSNLKLIVSEEKNPEVKVNAGTKFQAIGVTLVNPQLRSAGPVAARLCGGTSTCLALVELQEDS